MKRFLILFAVVANLVLADAITKELAAGYLKGSAAVSVIPNLFNLAYVENRGCAWGMFQGQVWPLAVFGLLALAVLVWQRRRIFSFEKVRHPQFFTFHFSLFTVSEPLLYAGILGNVIDRLFRGYVVDMLDFHWKNAYHYPCFNLADVYICVAAGLLILSSLLDSKEKVEKAR